MKKQTFAGIRKTAAFFAAAAGIIAFLSACSGVESVSKNNGSEVSSQSDGKYRTLDEIKKDGKINIGVFSDKNPFGYVDENNEYRGYDIYFAERLGKDLGVEINYVSTEAANRVEYLKTGKVDIILANFTVTEERAEKVDYAYPYMKLSLGYLEKNNPEIKLQKFDTYATAKTSYENGTGVAWANDNTEVIAFAKQNSGYTVGISQLGENQTIAPAVAKGNSQLLDRINEEIKILGEEKFFHKDYEETLADTYGLDYEDSLVIEGGKI